jgi:CubicO group peptidase (beta-lactamase class C family)
MNEIIQARIDRIVNNLQPQASLRGKPTDPKTLSDRMSYYHSPGVTIAVINDFKIEWAQGFGICDSQSQQPVTIDTLFQAGSISKAIFALGVMRIVQEGHLNLDRDINHYLTTWQIPATENWQPRITLRQILSHTAGLTTDGFAGYLTSEAIPTVPQILNGEPPANSEQVRVNIFPGMQFRYSGGGTTVAQQAVIDLLGKPFPQIMRELVLDRLQLNNSTYEQPLPERLKTQAATGHPSKGIPIAGGFHIHPEMAAAGLWTTPTDLAKVGIELMEILNDRSTHNLLTQDTLTSMLLPQLENQIIGDKFAGIGFFCDGCEDSFQFGHAGSNEGFTSLMRFYPNVGQGVVMMINSNEGLPLIFHEILRAIAIEYKWDDAISEDKTIISLENIERYVGLYLSSTGTEFEISMDGDRLLFNHGQQSPLPIYPSSITDFFSHAINMNISFEINDKQRITSMSISQAGQIITADRQYN